MHVFSKLIVSGLTAAALSVAAHAGEPGKGLKPQPIAPVQKQVTKTVPPAPVYIQRSDATTQLNLSEERRLVTTAPPPGRIVYKRTYVEPRYTYTRQVSSTCATDCVVQQPCQQTYSVCPTYAPAPQASPCVPPKVVRYSARPQPTPCAGYGYPYQPAPQPAPIAQPPVYHPIARPVETCGADIIERLSDTRDGRRQYSVCYSDINGYPVEERNLILLKRIEEASERACREATSSVLYSLRARRDCEEETTEEAVFASNVPGLVRTYNVANGKYIPNVDVGRPIYR